MATGSWLTRAQLFGLPLVAGPYHALAMVEIGARQLEREAPPLVNSDEISPLSRHIHFFESGYSGFPSACLMFFSPTQIMDDQYPLFVCCLGEDISTVDSLVRQILDENCSCITVGPPGEAEALFLSIAAQGPPCYPPNTPLPRAVELAEVS